MEATTNKNYTEKISNLARNSSARARNSWAGFSTVRKVAIVASVLVVLFVLYYLYRRYREHRQSNSMKVEPLFITQIHPAKTPFNYVDPATQQSTPYIPADLLREINTTQYTISFWLYINGMDWKYRFGEWKHIFHRGSRPTAQSVVDANKLPAQQPGVWLTPKLNNMEYIFTTAGDHPEKIVLENLELNQWTQITLTINNRAISVYRNGLLERTVTLFNSIVPSQDNVYVNYFGGFSGNLAYLQFFNSVLSPGDIQSLYARSKKNVDTLASGGKPDDGGNGDNGDGSQVC